MGDMAHWHAEVSIDIRSIQFIDDGQYLLVLTLPDDQLEGKSDVKVSRDGVTFQDGRSLRSNIVEQDEPEKTVEMKDNRFVFRLPKGTGLIKYIIVQACVRTFR